MDRLRQRFGYTSIQRAIVQTEPAPFKTEIKPGGGWDMWRKIAAQSPDFGNPDKFCHDPEQTNWMSATVTTLDQKVIPYIKAICKRDPFTGKVVTGGIVTVKDSGWLLSWTINRQPQFRNQPKDQCLVWVYSLFTDKPGNYVKKPMRDCTGEEICQEWLYHLGVPESEIKELACNSCNTVPVMMPYITAFFMPRTDSDRPKVVPDGAVNFAFLGQFAETERDTIFTTEYSMRTGMEAVYTLLNVDRGVPEVWGSTYDVRDLLNATIKLRDGKPLTDMSSNFVTDAVFRAVLSRLEGTDIEKLLKRYHVIDTIPKRELPRLEDIRLPDADTVKSAVKDAAHSVTSDRKKRIGAAAAAGAAIVIGAVKKRRK